MNTRFDDSFSDSLARLTGQEPRVVKTTAFDLQFDPSGTGTSLNRIDRAKDRNLWPLRVNWE